MLRLIIVCVFITTSFAAIPVFTGKYYTVYKLKDVELNITSPRAYGEYLEVVDGTTRTVFERPADGYDIPEDDGGNFGDIEFSTRPRNGTLIGRDTIVNQNDEEDLYIRYTREFPGIYIEDMRVINVGRERSWGEGGLIAHEAGYVIAAIYVKAGVTAKMFVEVFTRTEPDE